MRTTLIVPSMILALALTGCASSNDGKGVASAQNKTAGASPTASVNQAEQVRKLAVCLRANGLKVDDPQPGQGIQISSGTEADKNKAEKAMKACAKEAPQNSEEDSAKGRNDMLKYAQCMRQNGVEAFQDPKPGEGLNLDEKIGSDPDFKKAEETCGKLQGATGETAP